MSERASRAPLEACSGLMQAGISHDQMEAVDGVRETGDPKVGQHNLDVLRKGKRRIRWPGLAPQQRIGRIQISMEAAQGVVKRLGSRMKIALDDVEGRQA